MKACFRPVTLASQLNGYICFVSLAVLIPVSFCGCRPPTAVAGRDGAKDKENAETKQEDAAIAPYKLKIGQTRPTKAANGGLKNSFSYPADAGDDEMFRQRRYEFLSLPIDHYRETSNHPDDLKDAAIKAMESVFRGISELDDRPDWSSILEEFKRLEPLMAADRDPLILYGYGIALEKNKLLGDAKAKLLEAIEKFPKRWYPARTVVCAFNQLFGLNKNSVMFARRRPGTTPMLPVDYWEAVIYWLEMDFRADAYEHRFALQLLADAVQGLRHDIMWLEGFREHFQKVEGVPEWLRHMTYGEIENRLAWGYRGEGTVNTVPPARWESFSEHQQKAAEQWKKALELNPVYPEPAAVMIDIARNNNTRESETYWFEKSVSIQYDFPLAYRERLWGLYPRWGGTHERMIRFGKQCYEQGRFNTRVPYRYIDAITKVVQDGGEKLVKGNQEVYTTANDCLEKLYQHHIKSELPYQQQWAMRMRSYQATLNSLYGKHEIARKIYDEVGDNFTPGFENNLKFLQTAQQLRDATIKATVQYSPEIKKVIEFWELDGNVRQEKRSEIDGLLDGLAESNMDSYEKKEFHRYRRLNELEKQFYSGETVEVKFDPGFTMWESTDLTQFEYVDEHTINVSNLNANTITVMKWLGHLHGAKTVEYELEYTGPVRPKSANLSGGRFYFGMMFGAIEKVGDRYPTEDWSVLANGRDAVIGLSQWAKGIAEFSCDWPTDKKRFRVDLNGAYMEVRVDGRFVFVDDLQNKSLAEQMAIVIQPTQYGQRSSFRISNITVKQWPLNVLKTEDSMESELAMLERRLELDPENAELWEMMAQARFSQQQYDHCRRACEKALQLGTGYGKVGFFLGHLAETEGEMKSAYELYKKSTEASASGVHRMGNLRRTASMFSNDPVERAKIRYLWLSATHLDFQVASSREFNAIESALRPKYMAQWEQSMFEAMDEAFMGEYEEAVNLCKQAIVGAPSEVSAQLREQLANYEKFQMFITSPKERSYYLYDIMEQPLWSPRRLELIYGFDQSKR